MIKPFGRNCLSQISIDLVIYIVLASKIFRQMWLEADYDSNRKTDRVSDYLYMHMETISLAALASQIFQII